MTEVTVQVIATVGTVLAAVIGVVGARLARTLSRVRAQVENDHEHNLRDELDARHSESRSWWSEIRRDIGGMRQDIRQLRADDRDLAERIAHIERKEK